MKPKQARTECEPHLGIARRGLPFPAEAAHQVNDEADQQHETETAAAVSRTADIKATATEEKNKHNNHEE